MVPYRVLVVDDSPFMRKIISDLIQKDEQFTVVGTATNGVEGIAAVQYFNPDVITMDLEMPFMNGIDALQHILKSQNIPIIMLSGISEANTKDTIKALQYGAFDFIRKPAGPGHPNDIDDVGEKLLEKLRVAVLINRKTKLQTEKVNASLIKRTRDQLHKISNPSSSAIGNDNEEFKQIEKKVKDRAKEQLPSASLLNKLSTAVEPLQSSQKQKRVQQDILAKKELLLNNESIHKDETTSQTKTKKISQIIAIGTSTGGPRALHEVITSLPSDLNAPVLVVQHMPPRFTKSLAQRLDNFSALKVVEAEHGMKLESGKVYIAPGGKHMELVQLDSSHSSYSIVLTNSPQRNGHRPSVDVLFESLLPYDNLVRHVVLMTGMGSDGAIGMKKLTDQGVTSTIAEAEESCIVFGMPRSAIELGAANKILPLSQIAIGLVNSVRNFS